MVKPNKVLVVDDDNVILSLSTIALESSGYEVETAVDGQEAADILFHRHKKFDIVVTDGQMPKMDGLVLIKKIRMHTDSEVYNMPIILRSGNSELESVANTLGVTFLDKSNSESCILEKTVEKVLSES